MWDVTHLDADILWSIQRGLEVDVFDVKGDKFGAFAGKYAVEEELDEVNGRCFGSDVAGVGSVLPCYGDVSAVRVRFFCGKKCKQSWRKRYLCNDPMGRLRIGGRDMCL